MMHVLVCLAAAGPQVVSRRDLLDVVWRDTVVSEEVLTRAVSRLRTVFREDRSAPRYFETIRGGGYRLLTEPAPVPPEDASRAGRRTGRLVLAVAAAIIAICALIILMDRARIGPTVDIPTAVPVTTLRGNEAFPALSPDGGFLAFTWTGDEDESPGLFLKRIGTADRRRLTSPEGGIDTRAAFSPDGTTVAFVRRDGTGRSIRTVSVLGGATRLLVENAEPVMGMSWAPAGDRLVYASRDTATGVDCLLQVELATLAVRPFTTVDLTTHIGDSWPAFSPDGATVAYSRCDHAGLREVWLVSAQGGRGRQITRGLNDCQGLAWLPDGSGLVVSSPILGKTDLWHVDIAAGAISWVPMIATGTNTQPAVAADGSALVFRNRQTDFDLVRVDAVAGGGESGPADFAGTTRNECRPAWSADGRQVAFVTDRTGQQALFTAGAHGQEPRMLTSWPEAEIWAVHWAPGGRYLAADLVAADRAWVEIVDVETGLSRAPGVFAGHERFCGWDPEAGWIRVLRDEGEDWRLYRIREDGTDASWLGTELAGHPRLYVAADGFLYVDTRDGGLWAVPSDGRERWLVASADEKAGWRALHYGAAGLHVLRPGKNGPATVEEFELEDRTYRLLAEVPRRAEDLAVAPDGGAVLLTVRTETRSDIMLVPKPAWPER